MGQVLNGAMNIAISIGHYPAEPGAKAHNGQHEYGLFAPVAGYLIRYLQEAGVRAWMVPAGKLGSKVDWVNGGIDGVAFDLAIEVHGNADADSDGPGMPEAHGCETFYCEGSEKGERYANVVQATMARRTGEYSRGAKSGTFYWLRKTHMPALLIEPAFIDELRGSSLVYDKPRTIARGISQGVISCLVES